MKFPLKLLLITAICAVSASYSIYTGLMEVFNSQESSPQVEGVITGYEVLSVVDGDTFKVNRNGVPQTVRIVGIDTPETVDPRRPVECMGKEASAALTSLIAGKYVQLEPDATQANADRYGRWLRFVFLPDGTDVGKQLVAAGYAQSTLYSRLPHRYYDAYERVEAAARTNQLGLWNQSLCPLSSPRNE